MDELAIRNLLNELVNEIDSAPTPQQRRRGSFAELIRQTENIYSLQKQLKAGVDTLEELVDYLKFIVKYQSFDLEATRRENAYLRRIVGYDD